MPARMKIKFKLQKILFPKNGEIELNGYSAIGCVLIEQISGDSKIFINKWGNFTIKSQNSPLYNKYDEYTAIVEENKDAKYGIQYNLVELINKPDGISNGDKRHFLELCLTKGQVESLYEVYDDPYELIKSRDTEKLTQCKGIGLKSVKSLYKKYNENLVYEEMILELEEFNLTLNMMKSLLLEYKDPKVVIKKVKDNVYVLADEVWGIGFIKCDKMALNSGMPTNSPKRLRAFIRYYLTEQAENGNSWVEPSVLIGSIEYMLNATFSDDEIRKVLYELYEEKVIYWDEEKTKIALLKYYELEENICEELSRINNGINKYTRNFGQEQEIIKEIEKEVGFEFTEEQLKAVDCILDNNVSILIGYSGTGKTNLIRLLSTIFKRNNLSFRLSTLSGKASARIEEATGFGGSTIHRLLEYKPKDGEAGGAFQFNKENKMPYDAVVVDETSFVGGELFYSLIQAINNNSRLILVGDDKQLAAIGACNIFFDIINSQKFSVSKLTQIHRQAKKSGIITNATSIRKGEQITKNGWCGIETRGELQDFTVDIYNDRCLGRPKLLDYYKRLCPSLKDTFKTQIILPMKNRGDVCTIEINNEIQEIYNPETSIKSQVLMVRNGKNFFIREGDRVINRKNNYDATVYDEKDFQGGVYRKSLPQFDDFGKEIKKDDKTVSIFNGFSGEVIKIIDKNVIIKFDLVEDLIMFSYEDLGKLELAYAITCHSAQGSQYENIIFLIDNSSYIMNCRELAYTAITRASKKCILLAESSALKNAISNSQTIHKQTFLQNMLKSQDTHKKIDF